MFEIGKTDVTIPCGRVQVAVLNSTIRAWFLAEKVAAIAWDKEDLIERITTDPWVLLASDSQGAFLTLIGQIDQGKTSDSDIERCSRRWLSSPKTLFQLTIDAKPETLEYKPALPTPSLFDPTEKQFVCTSILMTDKGLPRDPELYAQRGHAFRPSAESRNGSVRPELSFHGIPTSCLLEGKKCNPCLRNVSVTYVSGRTTLCIP